MDRHEGRIECGGVGAVERRFVLGQAGAGGRRQQQSGAGGEQAPGKRGGGHVVHVWSSRQEQRAAGRHFSVKRQRAENPAIPLSLGSPSSKGLT
jgi:hypothetical protein